MNDMGIIRRFGVVVSFLDVKTECERRIVGLELIVFILGLFC